MSAAAHTPGPWRIEKPEDDLLKCAFHTIGERPTVEIWADGPNADGGFYHPVALVADNDVSNANLIAAAPDMLAALVRLVKVSMFENHPVASQMAIAAIAKATGGTNTSGQDAEQSEVVVP